MSQSQEIVSTFLDGIENITKGIRKLMMFNGGNIGIETPSTTQRKSSTETPKTTTTEKITSTTPSHDAKRNTKDVEKAAQKIFNDFIDENGEGINNFYTLLGKLKKNLSEGKTDKKDQFADVLVKQLLKSFMSDIIESIYQENSIEALGNRVNKNFFEA